MFIKKSFEQDLTDGMEHNLLTNAKEDEFKFNKVARAIELINRAASMFDQAGQTEASEALIVLLEKLSSSDPEAEVKNLLETGTMFPASEFKDAEKQASPANSTKSDTQEAKDTADIDGDDIDLDEKDLKDLESMFEDEG